MHTIYVKKKKEREKKKRMGMRAEGKRDKQGARNSLHLWKHDISTAGTVKQWRKDRQLNK